DAQVRYNTLVALGELLGRPQSASPRPPLAQLLTDLTNDEEPEIARHAWLLLGLLNQAPPSPLNPREADPEVAAAMLWAESRLTPASPNQALDLLADASQSQDVRGMAAYALHQAHNHPDAPRDTITAA